MGAGKDELRLTLLEPISDARKLSSGKIDAKLDGDLGRWWGARRLVRASEALSPRRAASRADSAIRARCTSSIDVLTLVNARFRGAGLDLEEPKMDAAADLTIDRKAGVTSFEKFTINSNPLTVTNGKLVINAPEKGELVVEGGGPSVVGLNRLGRTLKLYTNPSGPESLRGRGTGSIRFRHSAGITTFGGALDFVNFSYGLPTAPDWTEPTLRLEADGSYTESTDTLAFKSAKAERPGLTLDATLTFAKFDTTSDLNLNGKIDYDLAKLTPKLRELLGGGFSGQGKGSAPITLAGSLSPPTKPGAKAPPGPLAAMNGELRIGWDSLHAYGFDVGRSELHTKLTNGVGRVNPIHATFGGGKVTVHPTLFLDVEPSAATFAKGKIVDRAKLTPAVCADALGYALPAIAKSGKAEGEISIVLEENRIPLADPDKANVKGKSSSTRDRLSRSGRWRDCETARRRQCRHDHRERDGRADSHRHGSAHHQNFAVQIGGHSIATSGSVGFDGKLNLTADVRFPPDS